MWICVPWVQSLVLGLLCFCVILLVLSMELRASHMLGKCSTTELHHQPDTSICVIRVFVLG
jgi:hypothetical protein